MMKFVVSRRRGLSLTEVLIATVIMSLVAIPVIGVFMQSSQTVQRTDTRRELRWYVNEIMAHVNRQSLHDLFDNFGPAGFGNRGGKLRDQLAVYQVDGQGRVSFPPGSPTNDPNPLRFDSSFIEDLLRDGYEAQLHFEFYSRADLKVKPLVYDPAVTKDVPDPYVSILHMQAGYVTVSILDRELLKKNPQDIEGARLHLFKCPVMCPAIVGRPGLQLKACPAVNDEVKKDYGPILAARESSGTPYP